MFEELSDILKGRVDPAVWVGINAITSALEKHSATVWQERIITLRMDANNREMGTVVEEALHIIYDQVRALLQQMQITLELDTLSMDRLAMILEALVFTPNDLDSEALAALEAGEDTVEAFCDVLGIYLNLVPEELMEYVIDVSNQAILAIQEKLGQNLSYREETGEGVAETVRLLNRHQLLVGDTLTVGMESLNQGTAPGADMTSMVLANRGRLVDLAPDALADELLSLAILSKTPYDALEDEVMHFIEGILNDPFTIQRAFKRIRSRLGELPEHTP